jgi:hypothetical protein
MRRPFVTTLRATVLLAACGLPACPAAPLPLDPAAAAPKKIDLPNWCAAVDAALDTDGQSRGFNCLRVPNFLVTGFYGTTENPERSDFVNACFAGQADAAARLKLSVRPAGQLRFSYEARRELEADGSLDLGFLGPWAPRLHAVASRSEVVTLRIELEDAEIRVLSSVAEILGQEYQKHAAGSDAAPDGNAKGAADALENCLGSLCKSSPSEPPLVYTAKVLAAVPVISVRGTRSSGTAAGLALGAGTAQFELSESKREAGVLEIRAKEKLNVAALLEQARPALDRARTCTRLSDTHARRTLIAGLVELGLRVLSARDLSALAKTSAELRELVGKNPGAFSQEEQSDVLELLEALDLAMKGLAEARPTRSACTTLGLLEAVLGSGGGHQLHDTITGVAQPLQRRLTELANEHALPCAEPVWYRDEDGDGFGDRRVSKRAAKQPHGYVANSHDCFDRSRDARPGQLKFFSRQRGDGSFDYDCDGRETPHTTSVAAGCKSITRFGIPIRCWAESGWQGGVPACGRDGKWLSSCERSTLSCEEQPPELQQQVCR